MVETAPTGTEMPRRKKIPTLNFLSAHFRETEILFPLSLISVLSLWQVQSRRELVNLVLACDVAVCSLVSALLHIQGKVEQILSTVSLQGLFCLVSHSGKGALVGSLQLVHPKASPTAFTSCNSLLNSQDLYLKAVFSIRECLGVLHL